MAVVQFLLGLIAGAGAIWGLVWLLFVYPYGDGVSLKWAWWGLAVGVVLGVVSIMGVLYLWVYAWPKD